MIRFISIIALGVFFISAFPVSGSAEIVDRVIAIVNDDIITLKEAQRYIRVEQAGKFVSIDEYFRNIKIRDRLDTLIDDVLIRQQARKLKIDVSEREIEAIVENIKKQNLISDIEMREQLQKEGISLKDFKDGIKMNALRNRVLARAIIPDINVTEATLRDYYTKHGDEFRTEEIKLQQIFISGQRQDGQKRALTVYELLKEGKPFEKVAQEYSDEPMGAEGGDLGWVQSEELIPMLRDALKQVPIGTFTPVVSTPYGFHILKLNDIRKEDLPPFDQLKGKIQQAIVRKEGERKYKEYVQKLKESSYIEVKI